MKKERKKAADSYALYINSPQWKQLREKALARDGGRCRLCDSKTRLEVHHRAYPKSWGDDSLDNLTTLCKRCHDIITNELRGRRYAKRKPPAPLTIDKPRRK